MVSLNPFSQVQTMANGVFQNANSGTWKIIDFIQLATRSCQRFKDNTLKHWSPSAFVLIWCDMLFDHFLFWTNNWTQILLKVWISGFLCELSSNHMNIRALWSSNVHLICVLVSCTGTGFDDSMVFMVEFLVSFFNNYRWLCLIRRLGYYWWFSQFRLCLKGLHWSWTIFLFFLILLLILL